MAQDIDTKAVEPQTNRLERLGHGAPRRKPEGGPKELTARHKLLISYMIDGCGHRSICDRIWVKRNIMVDGLVAVVTRRPQPGEPLSLIEAADLLRIRRRNARELMTLPIFKRAYDEEIQRFREGERAASLHTLVAVRDDEGCGKAADRKVRMQASMALLGEIGSNATTVNVNVGGTHITAGIVIDLRDDEPTDGKTIEHEVPQ